MNCENRRPFGVMPDGTAVEEMEAGEWDLTLFTCTPDSRSRVTVRCVRTQEDEEGSMEPELIP